MHSFTQMFFEIFNKGAKTIQWGGGEKLSSSNKNKITRYSHAPPKKKINLDPYLILHMIIN